MQRFLLTLGFLLWFASSALALPSYCTLTGTVLSPDGTACAGCKITITTAGTQEVGGATFPGGKARSWTTESDGDLPAGVEAARTLIVKIQIDKGATVTVQIPDTSTADISTLLLEPIDVPSSTNINSLSGTLSVTKGGTGAAPDGDDQVLISTGTTAADWETIPDCDGVTKALNYDVTTNTFTCNSTISATDLACTGCVAAADLASDAVTEAKLKAVDSPTDEECLTYESTGGDFEWQTCGGGGGGTGDIEVVGDCTTGECFTAASGNNSLVFEGATADAFETTLTTIDPTADATVSLPKRTGTLALEKVVNLYDYAACDGTNEATGIQAAITAACALGPGGTLYVPADTCVFASTLTLCSGLAIVGSDSTERVAYGTAQPHELSYSGTGTAIDAQTFAGVRLVGLLLRATSASFAGPFIDFDGSSPNYSAYLNIDRVFMTAAGQAGAATCVLLSINNASDVIISNSAFSGCGYAIFGRTIAADFSNVVQITNSAFYKAEVCSIQNPGDTWDVHGNKWQQQGASSDESYIFCHGSGICSEGFNFTGNMIVDQPVSPTNAELTFCGSGFNIAGNFIGGGGTQDGILFDEACDGCSVQGNWLGSLDEGVKFSGGATSSDAFTLIGNDYDTVTTEVGGTRPSRSIMQEASANTYINETLDVGVNVDTDANSNSGAFIIGSNATSSSATRHYIFYEGARAEFRLGNDLRLYETDDGNYVQLSAPTLAADWTLTLPTTDGATNDLLYNTDGAGTLGWRTPNAGTDITADLEEETHASEHSLGGADAVTVTNLASACTNGQVLGGTAGGTGVECQADVDTDTNASTLCAGTTTYLDGEGNCDDISSVYAPIGATFITQTASAALTGEQAMGSLGTGIVINTTTTGVQSIYAGASCTNQFPRALSASGAATCASVAAADMAASSVVGGSAGTISDGTVDANDLGVDSVSASELNATGVEAELEAVMDLQDMQGAVTDAQVPDTITASNYLPLTGGTLSGPLLVNSSITGSTGSNADAIDFSNTFTMTGAAQVVNGFDFSPTATLSAAGEFLRGLNIGGSWAVSSTTPLIDGIYFAPTVDYSNTTDPFPVYRVSAGTCATAFTSSTANGPLYQDCWTDLTSITYSGASDLTDTSTATGNPWAPIGFLQQSTAKTSGTGDLTINHYDGLRQEMTYDAGNAASALIINNQDVAEGRTPGCVADNCGPGTVNVAAYSLVKGEFSTALDTGLTITNAYGMKLESFDKATNNYSLYSDTATTLHNGGVGDFGDNIADLTGVGETESVLDVAPQITLSNAGARLNSLFFSPDLTMSGIAVLTGVEMSPTAAVSSAGTFYGFEYRGTYTQSASSSSHRLLYAHPTLTSATAAIAPVSNFYAIDVVPTVSSTATSGTATPTSVVGVIHRPAITQNGAGGTMTLADDYGLYVASTYNETAGTLNITKRTGLFYGEYTAGGSPQVATQVGVDIAALSGATTNIGIRNADTTVETPTTQAITAITDTISPTASVVCLTANASYDLTSDPQISDGVDGQRLTLMNCDSSTETIELDDGTGLQLKNGLRYIMPAGESITLRYTTAGGVTDWFEESRSRPSRIECQSFLNVGASTNDNQIIYIARSDEIVLAVTCHTRTSTPTTAATTNFEDRTGDLIGSGAVTCGSGTTHATWTDVSTDADNALIEGSHVTIEVTNTPNPTTDEYAFCIEVY